MLYFVVHFRTILIICLSSALSLPNQLRDALRIPPANQLPCQLTSSLPTSSRSRLVLCASPPRRRSGSQTQLAATSTASVFLLWFLSRFLSTNILGSTTVIRFVRQEFDLHRALSWRASRRSADPYNARRPPRVLRHRLLPLRPVRTRGHGLRQDVLIQPFQARSLGAHCRVHATSECVAGPPLTSFSSFSVR